MDTVFMLELLVCFVPLLFFPFATRCCLSQTSTLLVCPSNVLPLVGYRATTPCEIHWLSADFFSHSTSHFLFRLSLSFGRFTYKHIIVVVSMVKSSSHRQTHITIMCLEHLNFYRKLFEHHCALMQLQSLAVFLLSMLNRGVCA